MTKLSVNINKIATLRNARGGNNPDLIQVAKDIERFGGQGITIHPRPDQRHIRYADAFGLAKLVKTEFNIEGNPKKGDFLKIVKELKPTQATLVPDADGALTSNAGWDTVKEEKYLSEVVAELKALGIRTAIFVDPVEKYIKGAAKVGTDRIELYTESYAKLYAKNPQKAIKPYQKAAVLANKLGLGINAGHDLDLTNLKFFAQNIPQLLEVSIGHAIVCDAIYYGLENTVQLYLRELEG